MGLFNIITGGKIWNTAGGIDSQTVYVHMYTLDNRQINDCK